MTVGQALALVDECKPNAYTTAQKLNWLSEAEGMIAQEILLRDIPPFTEADMDADLAAWEMYSSLYLRYMEAQMDYYNGDFTRCNNAMAMFNALYAAFGAAYRKTALTPGKKVTV